MIDLNTIWFALIGVLFTGYAILDGFDLGVGVLHFLTKGEERRRLNINAIGPVWDGNEVWLVTAGAALFAAFPVVYATVFSAFYLALILLLLALIFRAVSFEFRGKVESPRWRSLWDAAFSFGSVLPAIIFGVALGNILRGIPIDQNGTFTGTFLELLNPYALLIGILTLVLFVMHGAIYLTLKTDGDQRIWLLKWINRSWIAFVVLYSLATITTFFEAGYLFMGVLQNTLFWILILLLFGSELYIPVATKSGKYFKAFLSSSMAIAAMIGLAAVSLYPRLVPSRTDLAYSMTVYNASSTPLTLKTMLVIALIGLPLVVGYTIFIYRVFKGKVSITKESY